MSSESEASPNEKILWEGNNDEYLPQEIQQFEKELLGTYVSSHPLQDVEKILPLTSTRLISELKETADGFEVVVSGLITSLTHRLTKTNKPMVIGVLEDLTGSVEFVGFSEMCDKYEMLLKEGQKVCIAGKLQFRGDDNQSIVINAMRALMDIQILSLKPRQFLRYEDIAFLGQCLTQIRGEDPVIFDWPDHTQTILGQQFWIDSAKAESQLRPLLDTHFGQTLELAWVS